MSDMEYHKGKLKRVDLTEYDNSVSKFFESLCRKMHPSLSESDWEEDLNFYKRQGSDDPWVTIWFEETSEYSKYILIGGDVWESEDTELDSDGSIITKVNDDEFEYYAAFYNGGTCLSEELEYLLKSQLQKN